MQDTNKTADSDVSVKLEEQLLHDTKTSAKILNTTNETLKRSRRTGCLWGVPAPPFVKIGRMIKYRPEDLLDWVESQSKFSNNGQSTSM